MSAAGETLPLLARLMRRVRAPTSRNIQFLAFVLGRIRMHLVYRWRLSAFGENTLVLRPLFWTPESLHLGSDILIWPGCRIETIHDARGVHGTAPPAIRLGDGVTVEQNCTITAGGQLRIGSGTTISFDVMITDVDHGYERLDMRVMDQALTVRETTVGTNCFIGAGAKILAGTLLGDNCVVGANSVVRGIYPPGTVIAGNPARVIKRYNQNAGRWENVQ